MNSLVRKQKRFAIALELYFKHGAGSFWFVSVWISRFVGVHWQRSFSQNPRIDIENRCCMSNREKCDCETRCHRKFASFLQRFRFTVVGSLELFRDEDEWRVWRGIGDQVLHIELSKWADVMVIAPLDANTMAKMANGICDNLLTCVARAWNEKPLMFCPAMNTNMWLHPVTSSQVDTLKSWGYFEVPCVEKKLACGDFGLGGMAELDTIVGEIWKRIT